MCVSRMLLRKHDEYQNVLKISRGIVRIRKNAYVFTFDLKIWEVSIAIHMDTGVMCT